MLATLLGHMWRLTRKRLQLHIRWVRGHTGDVRNTIADRLADSARNLRYNTCGGGGPMGREEVREYSEGDHAVY